MVDDVKDILETAQSTAYEADDLASEPNADGPGIERARLARERREAEQRRRLEELRAHAAAAQAQRERRDEDRRRRQAEQRARDTDRRSQVEERKRAIWEASVSRREALLQRERDREQRLERARQARSAPRPAFAFGSSTPRLLEPVDSAGFFWAARSTNPIDQMNFFDSLASSTSNVMFASAPLMRRASALQLDGSDIDNKDEADRPPPAVWSSVARRRTDLVPTLPAPRAPGRAQSMIRLDRLPSSASERRPVHSASPSLHHLNRTRHEARSGETTPGSRPGSAMSSATAAMTAGVVRRAASTPRRPRPASIAGTGVNTPRVGAGDASLATTPSVSRDGTATSIVGGAAGVQGSGGGGGDVPRRTPVPPGHRRPRPLSLHAAPQTPIVKTPGDGKPPIHRKPKLSKDQEKTTPRGVKAVSPSPTPSSGTSKQPSVDKEVVKPKPPSTSKDRSQVNANEITEKLEALQIDHETDNNIITADKQNLEPIPNSIDKAEVNVKSATEMLIEDMKRPEPTVAPKTDPEKPVDAEKPVANQRVDAEKPVENPKVDAEKPVENQKADAGKSAEEKVEVLKPQDKRESVLQEKTDDSEMTASMTARRITTEEEAKAALAERRRRAREELERQADLEKQRLQREAEEEAERQRQEEEQQRREEEEARELARLQRELEQHKLTKAIEAQQQLEREEAERKAREETERQARIKEEEEKKRALEEADRLRREELEREERERVARRQRVEAIMSRTRLRKAEEDKKQDKNQNQNASSGSEAHSAAGSDNGNDRTADLLGIDQGEDQLLPNEASGPRLVEVNSQPSQLLHETTQHPLATNNGNVHTDDLLGMSIDTHTEVKQDTKPNQPTDNAARPEPTNNGNANQSAPLVDPLGVGLVTASFLQAERVEEINQKSTKLNEGDFASHNGHPLTLQNAI